MSDCNVCLYSGDEVADVFTAKEVTAAKAHKCYECDRPILKGTKHQIVTMLYEGEWSRFRTCLVCAEIRKAFYCDGETIGEFWNQMEEYAFPEVSKGSDCLKKLTTPEAKRYFAERFRQWNESRN